MNSRRQYTARLSTAIFCLISLGVSLTSCTSGSSDDAWLSHQNAGRTALSKNDFAKAESELKETIGLLDGLKGHSLEKAVTLGLLGTVYNQTGRLKKAEEAQKQSLEIYESSPQATKAQLSSAYNNLSNVYYSLGRYEYASELNQKALKLIEESNGSDSLAMASTLNNEGLVQMQLGKSEAAKELFEKALSICEKHESNADFKAEMIKSLINLAHYWSESDADKSIPLCEKAIKIAEGLYGENHVELADALRIQGVAYTRGKQFDNATTSFKRAKSIYDDKFGEHSVSAAYCLNGLSMLYLKQQQYDKALPLAEQAVKIFDKSEVGDVEATVNALCIMAEANLKQDNKSEAKKLLARCKAKLDEAPNVSSEYKKEFLKGYAKRLREMSDVKEAEQIESSI